MDEITSESESLEEKMEELKQQLDKRKEEESKLLKPLEEREKKLNSLQICREIDGKLLEKPNTWICLPRNQFEELNLGSALYEVSDKHKLTIPARKYREFYPSSPDSDSESNNDGEDEWDIDWEDAKLTLPDGKVLKPFGKSKFSDVEDVDWELIRSKIEDCSGLKCCGYSFGGKDDVDGDKDGLTYRNKIVVPLIYLRAKKFVKFSEK